MRIGICGVGTVGSALANTMKHLGHEVRRYDPAKGHFDELSGSDVMFVAIYNAADIDNVIDQTVDKADIVVIKTTVPPGTTDRLIDRYGSKVAFVPEFLDSRTAEHDCLHPDKVVIGSTDDETIRVLSQLLGKLGRLMIMKPVEAEILKVSLNSFYATKVTFACEVADLCEAAGADYSMVRRGFAADRYVANQHMEVNKDGYRGFGGHCLPKDTDLFIDACHQHGLTARLVHRVREINRRRRGDQYVTACNDNVQ